MYRAYLKKLFNKNDQNSKQDGNGLEKTDFFKNKIPGIKIQ